MVLANASSMPMQVLCLDTLCAGTILAYAIVMPNRVENENQYQPH